MESFLGNGSLGIGRRHNRAASVAKEASLKSAGVGTLDTHGGTHGKDRTARIILERFY